MRRYIQLMLEEPLIPFALIGCVLFVGYGFRKPTDEIETISISTSTVRSLETMQEELTGRPLTEAERQEVFDGYVDDEVLMREAFRRELEKKDSRVRKRLLSVMRSTLDQPIAQPTRPELEAYFRENQDQFLSGEVITFDHVFFSFGSENEPDDWGMLLSQLRKGEDHQRLGDNQMFGNVMRRSSARQLRQSLGNDFAERAFASPLDQWQGPIESRHGTHFIRVSEKFVPPVPDFEQMEDYLRQDWTYRKRRENQAEKIAELRDRYRIVIDGEQ